MVDVIVIGGGASGIATAIMCGRKGLDVLVLEANDRVLKKLLATGNGKCNFSNKTVDISRYNTDFVRIAIDKFSYEDAETFFESLGMLTTYEEDRLYPYSRQAATVLYALMNGTHLPNIEIRTGEKVTKIDKGYTITTTKGKYSSKCVVLATGSNATTGMMSHDLVSAFHHNHSICTPSLTYLTCDKSYVVGLNGIRIKAAATIKVDGKNVRREGELLFKNNALSGIMIFELSSFFARGVVRDRVVDIDMAPDMTKDDLRTFFEGSSDTLSALMGFLPKQLAILIDKMARNDKNKAINLVKSYRVPILGLGDIKNAQVVSGGLDIEGFDESTLESRYSQGLYATGEVLDVDGECGGFNLHWAWASANLVAQSIGKKYGKN